MRIKKLEVTYGGYFSTNYEVKKKRNKLYFDRWEYAPGEEPSIVKLLSPKEWTELVNRLIEIIAEWKPVYDNYACDGTQWTVDIQTEQCKYKVYGSNDFPENFEDLVRLIRSFGGFEKFAEGLLDEDEVDE